jgi:hypothetical protein
MSSDVVCVLNASLAQVFELARPVKASVKPEAKPMEHPLESGAVVTDHIVFLPLEVELSMVLAGEDNYRATYKQIRDLFGRGELLTVQTRADSYPSLAIVSMPHEESPESFDALVLALKLREVQFVEAQFTTLKVKHAKDSRTAKRGEQQAQAPAARQKSVLSSFFGK